MGIAEAGVARDILEWSRAHFSRLAWGKGAIEGPVAPTLDHGGSSHWVFYHLTNGTIEIPFWGIRDKPPFDQQGKRLELLSKLNEIPGIDLPETAIEKRPRIPLATFSTQDALAKLFDVLEWFLEEARSPRP